MDVDATPWLLVMTRESEVDAMMLVTMGAVVLPRVLDGGHSVFTSS